MTDRSPFERRERRRRHLRSVALFALALIALTLLDPLIARAVWFPDRLKLHSYDLYITVRSLGSLWVWMVIALVLYFHDRVWDRAGSVALAPTLAGVIAEIIKRIVPRSRPVDGEELVGGWHDWRPLFSGFTNDSNLGLPSSHAAVAFAGCLVLTAFFPRARWVFLALAAMCAFSRMVTGAHFASDVLVGAAIGWWCARLFEPPQRRTGPRSAEAPRERDGPPAPPPRAPTTITR